MSVQSVSSAPAATDPGPARKRAAEAESGQTGEAFALPDAAPETAAAPGATQKSEARTGPSASKTEPFAAKVEPAAKAAPVAPVVIVPDPTGAKPVAVVPETPSQPALPQSGVDALLAAAIAAQGETLPKKDTDEVGEKDAAEAGSEAAAALVDPAALLIVAPVATDAKPSHAAAEALAAAALAGAPATASGAVPAADTPAAAVAAAAPALGAVAALTTAATGKPAAQTVVATGPLQGSQADIAKSPEAALADTAGAGHPAAHLAKGGAAEPAPPVAAQDVAQPELKLTEALQPLQGAIDLSALAQARPARPDSALTPLTPEQAATAQAANAQAQTATGGPPTPMHVVPIEIGLRALAGGRKFDIRLDPAELGRVDVSLDISDAGEVTAKLVVDRVETLHMLQRDARTLERAFEQAGLKPSNAGVEISLRDPADQGFRQNRQHDEAPRRTPSLIDLGDDPGLSAQPVQSTSIRGLLRLGGVDLSI